MPSINKCIVFLALALSVSAFSGSGYEARAFHRGLARHIQRGPNPGMDMVAPNPLKKRHTTRSNSARCKASEAQASSASASSAAASKSAAAAASKSSEQAKASSEAAAATSSSSEANKNPPAKPTKSPQPSPTSDHGGHSDNSGGGLISGGIATYFLQNGVAGACGITHSDDDYVCALQTQTYAGGSKCGKMVAITNDITKKTINVLVADECPTCDDSQSIDLSKGAFKALGGTTEEGQFPISWKLL